MLLTSGKKIGRYEIKKYVGEGGMQEVYRATDTLLGRDVAIKCPKNDDGERRFDRSAHLSAQVSHANVARTLDYFESNRRRYLIEEFVNGLDLGEIMRRVPQLDPYAAAQIVHAIARGIAAVHAVNVVHRDLKPSNIMIAGGMSLKEIKVTDFGVAKMSEAEVEAGIAGGPLSLTGSKTLIGHLPYLAPEILRRRKTVSPAADIWAIGALAFHFLVGAPPFGTELADAVTQILNAPVPPLPSDIDSHPQLRDLAREIYGIAVTCLQRDPEARPTGQQLVRLCERLCYPIIQREVGTVNGYPGGSFGFASARDGEVFFHVASLVSSTKPRIGSEIWFARHDGSPRDRAHPIVPLSTGETP